MSDRRADTGAGAGDTADTGDPTLAPPTHSLVVRTSAALAAGLVLAALALLLLFGPYLRGAFETESGNLLRDQAARHDAAARADASVAVSQIRAAGTASLDAADAALRDTPLELVTKDADAVRELAGHRLDELRTATSRNMDVLADEISRRTETRRAAEQRRSEEASRQRAEEFGSSIAMRAAALLLALLAALFLLHGFLLYRAVLAPVRRLGEATRDVAQGRLGTRLEVRGDDEVARLARSFNRMTVSLEDAHRDLASLNRDLEERVRTKTAELRAALDESREANRRLERAMEELRTKESALRQAEKMASLGTLAGGVAHEFNNLLGGILGCAEDAAHEDDDAELRETLRMIERTARRGTAITENLLRFARPGGRERGEVDAAELLRDVRDLVGPEATRLGVTVDVRVEDGTTAVADASGLHQVLLNLATNALHAMRERGGALTLSAGARGDELTLSVADTGHGISGPDRERLFEPFFTTRGPEGTGLGLSVSYGIVGAHGGRIEVDSEPGHGATFRVVIPRRPAPAPGGDT